MRRIRSTHLTALAIAGALALSGCGSTSDDMTAADDMASTATSTATDMNTDTATDMKTDMATDMETTAPPSPEPAAMLPGAYLTLAEYRDQAAQREGSTVVFFFHAPWCPSCRATEESLTTEGVPAGLTVVKVDYDSETDLRREYGITQQHTFVQVDPDGAELAKWTGSTTAAQIKAETV
jgi:thioredoxin 1